MNILKPRKSKFDEDLASRINKQKTATPEKKTVTPAPNATPDSDEPGFIVMGKKRPR